MPRKPPDVRKAYGRLLAYGKQKAPWGRLVLALCLNTVRRRGSRQAERGINSRGLLSLQINFHFEFVLYRIGSERHFVGKFNCFRA